jgi:hypothetical protein
MRDLENNDYKEEEISYSDDEFQDLDDDIVESFKKTESEFNIPIVVKYAFQAALKQKELIKISKIPKQFESLINAQLLVQINPKYFDMFDDETNKILFEEKIDYICVNMNNGSIKLNKPKIQIAPNLAQKHGFEKVLAAKESEKTVQSKIELENAEQNNK